MGSFDEWLSRTMLLERLAGVITYSAIVLIVFLLIKSSNSMRKMRISLNFCLFLLTILAFFFVPAQTSDLYRWRQLTPYWQGMSFPEFFSTKLRGSSYPIGLLYIYLLQHTRIEGLLPAFCAFVFFYNIFAILKLMAKKGAGENSIAVAFFFFMSTGRFLEVISGIRSLVAISILAHVFCLEFVDKKPIWKGIVWGVVASLIHPLALIVLLIRMVFYIFQPSIHFFKRLLGIALDLCLLFLFYRFGRTYIDNAFDTATSYISSTQYSYIWEYIIASIVLLLMVFFMTIVFRNRQRISKEMKTLAAFNLCFLLLEIVFAFQYSIMHRLVTFSSIMMMPLLVYVFEQNPPKHLTRFVTLISVLILLLACSRGDMSSFKFFNLV